MLILSHHFRRQTFSVIKHNSSVLFISSIIIYFGQRSHLKRKFFYYRGLESKFAKFLKSMLKLQVNSSSNFASFFIVITYISSVVFKLIHFLLWTKGPHQSARFYTYKCSGENLLSSSCHFPNHKSVFIQILHQFSECHERYSSVLF